jgi:Recombinase
MAKLERIREAVRGPLDTEYIRKREAEGWRLMAIEWEVEWARDVEGGEPAPTTELSLEEAPFGFRVSGDCERLEENPTEMEFLLSMMELIIQDISLSKVAEELNRKGFRTRKGGDWGAVAVFNMLPRLIELTPRIFASAEWIERRKRLSPVY